MPADRLPRVAADGPLMDEIVAGLQGKVELLPWSTAVEGSDEPLDGLYTYGHVAVDGPMMDRARGLKVVSNFGVGVDHIDLVAAAERNIPVGNTPGTLDGTTADMGFAMLMASARRIVEGDGYARSDRFTQYDPSLFHGREVHGSTLGIVGLGRIGSQVARRAAGFDMRILYTVPKPEAVVDPPGGAVYAPLDTLLSEADFVMLCVPLTHETRGLIGREQFARMKRSATLINIARGGVVDHDALCEALATRQIAAAAIDVTEPEPLPRDHPLLQLDNLTITPHLGSATGKTRGKMAQMSIANLLAGLAGKPLLHQIRAGDL